MLSNRTQRRKDAKRLFFIKPQRLRDTEEKSVSLKLFKAVGSVPKNSSLRFCVSAF